MTTTTRNVLIAGAAVVALAGLLAYEIVATRPVREAVRAYSDLIAVANHPGMTDADRAAAARPYFSSRRLASGSIRFATEGGVEGLPRSIGRNFRAWREGGEVWLCPTGRTGVVHRLVEEDGRWKLDGLVGYLRGTGELIPATDGD
ncbi:hypothetical protein [Paludisphaera sp.]|uniref:hypothetical protein n=1 Tax=Paludisphaera sp. TaxID=2017432 RepID=UPI00301DC9A9